MRQSLGKSGDLAICILLVLVIPQLATAAAGRGMGWLPPVDPDGAYLWATLHHLAQLLLTLLAALLLGVGRRELGFNLDRRGASLALLRGFLLYFIGFVTLGHVILYFTSPVPQWGRPLNALNVLGELGFKALLSGTAEEPLFRGLVMVVLFRSWQGASRWVGVRISHAGLIATGLFIVAHIGFTLFPLRLTLFSPIQLVQAAVLGFFYAVAFDRTRSLLTPILAHNFANVYFTVLGMLWAAAG